MLVLFVACGAPTALESDAKDTDSDAPADSPPPDADADGDGYAADVDCDDADPTIHPDQADPCDGLDQDCDGVVADEGACGEVTEVATTAHAELVGSPYSAALDCLWDTNAGSVDLDLGGSAYGTYGGWSAYGWDGVGLAYVLDLYTAGGDTYYACTVVGDMDGDGWDDVAIHGGSTGSGGAVALYSGDRSTWPTTPVYVSDGAYGHWTGHAIGDGFSEEVGAGDVTGDGLTDLVVHEPNNQDNYDPDMKGWLYVIPGRTGGFPAGASVDDDPLVWTYEHSRGSPSSEPLDELFTVQAVHPDLDGDGLADVLAVGDQGTAIVPGANLASMQGALLEDLVAFQIPWEESVAWDNQHIAFADYDGDGVGDLWAAMSDAYDTDEVIVSGALFGAGATARSAALAAIGSGPLGAEFGHTMTTGRDLDADGFPELVVEHDRQTYDGTICIVASAWLPRGGVADAADLAPCWHHAIGDDGLQIGDLGDVDADGLPDLVLARTGGRDGFPVIVLPGLVLPWDDPTRW